MLGEGPILQSLHYIMSRIGKMDRLGIHVTLIDAQVVDKLGMGERRPLDMRVSWRKLVS